MSAAKGKEKRGSPRVAADLRLYLDEQGEMVEMQLANVSLGGAYCHSPRAIEPMTKIEVVLELPAELPLMNAGGRAYVRFDHGTEPLGFQLYRRVRQLFLSRFHV